jgi:NADH dehydrogenase FAD-containing subunit
MSQRSSEDSYKYLTKLGVKVTSMVVSNFDGNNVQLKDGSSILAKTVIWAGVTGALPPGLDKTPDYRKETA